MRDQRDEPERDREVEEPGPEVEAAERALPQPERQEELPQRPSDRRPGGPPGLDHREPARLEDEAGHVDGEEEREEPGEVRSRVDAGRAHDEAAVEREAQPQDEEEPEQVERQLVDQVEGALEELEVEAERQPQRDVVVDGREDGPQQEGAEAPEHERVHHARIPLCQDPALEQPVAHEEADPLGNAIEARLGLPLPPERDALPDAEREYADRDDRERVQEELRPGRDVPEGVAERNVGEGRGRGGVHALELHHAVSTRVKARGPALASRRRSTAEPELLRDRPDRRVGIDPARLDVGQHPLERARRPRAPGPPPGAARPE